MGELRSEEFNLFVDELFIEESTLFKEELKRDRLVLVAMPLPTGVVVRVPPAAFLLTSNSVLQSGKLKEMIRGVCGSFSS